MRTLLIRLEAYIILALVINIGETAHLADKSFRLVVQRANESNLFGCLLHGSNRKLRP